MLEQEISNIGKRIAELEAKKMRFWIALSFVCMVVIYHSLPSSHLVYDLLFTDLFLLSWASQVGFSIMWSAFAQLYAFVLIFRHTYRLRTIEKSKLDFLTHFCCR